jgi:hypothetical protein
MAGKGDKKMSKVNAESYYKKYKDLYHESITTETVVGFQPNKNILLLEVIPECPKPELSSANKGGLLRTQTSKAREPVVFRVIAAGEGCTYEPNQLVLLTHLAGDRFAGSDIILCRDEDVFGAWGEGILQDGQG